MQTDINGHTPPNPDVYRLNLMDTDINAHKQISRGAWFEPWEISILNKRFVSHITTGISGRVWGARWEG
jgi:hypothetical protein